MLQGEALEIKRALESRIYNAIEGLKFKDRTSVLTELGEWIAFELESMEDDDKEAEEEEEEEEEELEEEEE